MNLKLISNISFLSCGIALILGYVYFGYFVDRSNFTPLFTVYTLLFICTYLLTRSTGKSLRVLITTGVIFRLVFLIALPLLSQDYFRFIWDGRLLTQGINPYLITPQQYLDASNYIVPQATELYKGMGGLNASHYSNYPPLNQLCFAIASFLSNTNILGAAITFRVILIIADIGIVYYGLKLLAHFKLPKAAILIYFLNPFVIIELTGNLHFEPVMLLFFIASLYYFVKQKHVISAILLGCAISVKLIPLLFLPLFFKSFVSNNFNGILKLVRFYSIVLTTTLITFLPFISLTFIDNFAATIGLWFQNFEFNASIYYIIRWFGYKIVGWNIIATVGKILPLLVICWIVILTFYKNRGTHHKLITTMLFACTGYYTLATTVHPWYIALPLLLSVFTTYRYIVVWSFTCILSYTAYGPSGFAENLYAVALEYLVVLFYLIWELKNKPLLHIKQV